MTGFQDEWKKDSALLLAVEEAGGEEDHGNGEGQAGVEPVVKTKAHKAVHHPCYAAREPYPQSLPHRPNPQ